VGVQPYLVGITGGSCSGKSFFVSQLFKQLGQRHTTLVSQDNYYWPIDRQPKDGAGKENFDLPESFDSQLFSKDVKTLMDGQPVEKLEHVFNNPALTAKVLKFDPAPIILVEGIFVFHFPEVADKLDLKIFVDAPEHVKIKRRIMRDQEERGYGLEQILYQYENHVMPNYQRYILPHRNHADLVINTDRSIDTALSMVTSYLKTKISESHAR